MSNDIKLICITGPDGSGKTTQITKLAEYFAYNNAHKVVAVTIWDLLLEPKLKTVIPFNSPREVDAYLGILDNLPRSLFLYHCFKQALESAYKKNPQVILLNAYWYKYFATEVVHGSERQILKQLAESIFPEPEVTFYLNLEPELAFERKTEAMLSSYETGFAAKRDKESFLNFQSQLQHELEKLAVEKSWVKIEATQSIKETTEQILAAIND